MKLYGNEQALISADIDKLMSIKRFSDICKIKGLLEKQQSVPNTCDINKLR